MPPARIEQRCRGKRTHQQIASALMTCPIVVLFFFVQRQFIGGMNMTGIKG
jgi:ABC-type maltose transport system permease subunit